MFSPDFLVPGVGLAAAHCSGRSARRQIDDGLTSPPADAIVNLVTDEGVALGSGATATRSSRRTSSAGTGQAAVGRRSRPMTCAARRWRRLRRLGMASRSLRQRLITTLHGPTVLQLVSHHVTIPETLGGFDPTGATVVFEMVVDDYAEVWVDGELPRRARADGRRSSSTAGTRRTAWSSPATPTGPEIQLAVFGANGPLSNPPPTSSGCARRRWISTARGPVADHAERRRRGGARRSRRRCDRAAEPEDREARRWLQVHRRPGLGAARRLPALQRSQQEHHLPMDARRPGLGVPHQEWLRRHRHRRVWPARLERPHARHAKGA